ncbi:MAG: hypothetical protein KAI15_02095, partial [Gammaproteobacteria bacterium]|nr:hypothetical protein [Gammaproteobacteria bacterium]
LGAVSPRTVAQVIQWVRRQQRKVSISATIGDCWESPSLMPGRVARLAAAGVGYAKIGIYGASPSVELLQTITQCCRVGPAIILVCFAEEPPCAQDIRAYAPTGIGGVMLDTANKSGPNLPGLMAIEALGSFVAAAREHGLLCGLAGRLKVCDIETLLPLGPDYLGFRGALCLNTMREADFSLTAAMKIRACIDEVSKRNDEGIGDQPNPGVLLNRSVDS